MNIKREKVSDHHYRLIFGGVFVGDLQRDVDGFFYYWDNKDLIGCTSSWTLKEIACHLDELNKPYEDSINEYFKYEGTGQDH